MKSRNKMVIGNLNYALWVILPSLLIGCADSAKTAARAVEKEWIAAQRANTIESYEAFARSHPESTRLKEAQSAVEDLRWAAAQKIATETAIAEFITRYPSSSHSADAASALEAAVWAAAEGTNRATAYLAFYKRFPTSSRIAVSQGTAGSAQVMSLGGGGSRTIAEVDGKEIEMDPRDVEALGLIETKSDPMLKALGLSVVSTKPPRPATIIRAAADKRVLAVEFVPEPKEAQ